MVIDMEFQLLQKCFSHIEGLAWVMLCHWLPFLPRSAPLRTLPRAPPLLRVNPKPYKP